MPPVIKALRPAQWIKNIFVFAAIIFAQELANPQARLESIGAFVIFSLTASSIYLFNDLKDKDEDRFHPHKKHRPIASGDVSVSLASVLIPVILFISLAASYLLYSWQFLVVILFYVIINILYSIKLKKVVILDLILIAVGFVLRAMAGALAIHVFISPWLLTATFFLALFLVLGKRRHELLLLGESSTQHRYVLGEYSQMVLDGMLMIVTSVTIVMYVLYTLSPRTIEEFGSQAMFYTVVFVVYGIFRVFFLIYEKNKGGAPTELLLIDRPLQINVLLWLISVLTIIYIL